MRTLSALLMVLLLCSVQQTCSGTEYVNALDIECCSEFVKVKIPFRRIISYSMTRSNCPKQAVIFKTISGKKLCADLKAAWVQEHMKKLNP